MQGLPKLFIRAFTGKNIFYHLIAILITFLLIVSGLDWRYFLFMNEEAPRLMLFSADTIGWFMPIIIPGALFIIGKLHHNASYLRAGWVVTQSVIAAFLIALFYKSITGRVSPPHHGTLIDNSNQWNFGFLEHSVLGGWPSSHATIMFAIAACLVTLFPKTLLLRISIYTLALYIGFGVAIGFHWLSELTAGILIGTVVGRTAARLHLHTHD